MIHYFTWSHFNWISQHGTLTHFNCCHQINWLLDLLILFSKHQHNVTTVKSVTVASLTLVSPGAVTDGVTLFTSKTDDLFNHRHHSHPLRLSGWRLSSVRVNSAAKSIYISLGCHPLDVRLDDVTRGGGFAPPAPSLRPSDATTV